jgi:cobyrinic acid a,c-diamide synthase
VAPFKKGPDYIDAGWLAQAAQAPCYNLDPYLMNPDAVAASFALRTAAGPEVAVIEGNRGLFDGFDQTGASSTAELAKSLGSPVVLIVDCTKSTRTVAALVHGCRTFDPDLNLAGVILNQVATGRQENLIRSAVESCTGLPVLGAAPRVRTHDLPERHLGLIPPQEHPRATKALDLLARLAADHLDLDRLLALARAAGPPPSPSIGLWPDAAADPGGPITVGVIRDSVFQFYYPENLELLERLGGRIHVFSALDVDRLPDVDALYLGGGFPETQAELLADHQELRDSIRLAVENGLPVYAECGGLMYLGRDLILGDRRYPMTGVFPVSFTVEKKPQGHGYTRLTVDRENPYFRPGVELRGHEFHYSRPVDYRPDQVHLACEVVRGTGFDRGRDALYYKNVFASYTHLHGLTEAGWARSLIRLARAYRGGGADSKG